MDPRCNIMQFGRGVKAFRINMALLQPPTSGYKASHPRRR